jgi:hypothetical protein
MTVAVQQDCVVLTGNCGTDDVEPLLAALTDGGHTTVDLTDTEHLHTAVLQVLLAFRPNAVGSPGDTFVRSWLKQVLLKAPSPRAPPQHC